MTITGKGYLPKQLLLSKGILLGLHRIGAALSLFGLIELVENYVIDGG